MRKYKLGIIGSGYLSEIIADAYTAGLMPQFELVAVLGNNPQAFADKYEIKGYTDIDAFLENGFDYVAEAAAIKAVKDYGVKILNSGSNLTMLSIGALADEDFYNTLSEAALKSGKQVMLPSGAIGGLDVISTIRTMGDATTHLYSKKNPNDLHGTVLMRDGLTEIDAVTPLFKTSAKEAIDLLPTKLNIAVATALAGNGLDDTTIEMEAYPNFSGDHYFIETKREGYHAKMDIYSETSSIAAWSVVSLLNNAVSAIRIG